MKKVCFYLLLVIVALATLLLGGVIITIFTNDPPGFALILNALCAWWVITLAKPILKRLLKL